MRASSRQANKRAYHRPMHKDVARSVGTSWRIKIENQYVTSQTGHSLRRRMYAHTYCLRMRNLVQSHQIP